MARPTRCRLICKEPIYNSFSPNESTNCDDVMLSVDEYETIRLIDLEKLTHEQCSKQMAISRTTVTELYESARYKIADCIVKGKQLLICGGNYRICDGTNRWCSKKCEKAACAEAVIFSKKEGNNIMKIAVTYENGKIFQHFGHTEYFKIYIVENKKIIQEDVLSTNGSGHGALAGFLKNADVDVLICGGIGAGAQNALQESGIKFFGGVSGNADDAVNALLGGTLSYNPNVHCNHHNHNHGDTHSCEEHGCYTKL